MEKTYRETHSDNLLQFRQKPTRGLKVESPEHIAYAKLVDNHNFNELMQEAKHVVNCLKMGSRQDNTMKAYILVEKIQNKYLEENGERSYQIEDFLKNLKGLILQ